MKNVGFLKAFQAFSAPKRGLFGMATGRVDARDVSAHHHGRLHGQAGASGAQLEDHLLGLFGASGEDSHLLLEKQLNAIKRILKPSKIGSESMLKLPFS